MPVLAQRVVAPHPLAHEQTLETVGVLDPLPQQPLPLTLDAPPILFLDSRWADHRADPRLATRESHQRSQQRLAVDPVTLGSPHAAGDGDRGRIDYPALDALALEQAVQREAVQPRFLNRHNRHRRAHLPLMEPFAFLEHDAEELMALLIRQVRVVSKNFREAPDHCQRRLQVRSWAIPDNMSSYDVNGTLFTVPTSCAGGAGRPASGRLRRNALADERQELRRRQWPCGGLTLRWWVLSRYLAVLSSVYFYAARWNVSSSPATANGAIFGRCISRRPNEGCSCTTDPGQRLVDLARVWMRSPTRISTSRSGTMANSVPAALRRDPMTIA